MAALAAALEHGTPLDQPQWLKQIDESDLKTILYPAEGFHPLPMLSERVAALQEPRIPLCTLRWWHRYSSMLAINPLLKSRHCWNDRTDLGQTVH